MNGATIAEIPPNKKGTNAASSVPSVPGFESNHPNSNSMSYPLPEQTNNMMNSNNINYNAHNNHVWQQQQQQQQQTQYPMQYYDPSQPYYQTQQMQHPNSNPQQFQYHQYPPPGGYPMNNPYYGNIQQQQYGYQGNVTSTSPSSSNQRKTTLKLVILGNSGVGKTSLMNQFHSNKFTGQYKATIGADFLSKTIQIDDCTVVLTIWDTAGQERFQSLGKAFYRGSDACLLVYDVQDVQSLHGLRKWKEEFESCIGVSDNNTGDNRRGMSNFNRPSGFKFIVVGNKADKDDESRMVSEEEGRYFAKEIGAMFFECSAKTAMNVNEAFISAAREGLEYNRSKNMGLGGSAYTFGQSVTNSGMTGPMRGYIPPKKTVDLNRSSSSRMSNSGDCC